MMFGKKKLSILQVERWEVLITICERKQDHSLAKWMRIDKSEHQQSTSG
jgi:hypothetical protein